MHHKRNDGGPPVGKTKPVVGKDYAESDLENCDTDCEYPDDRVHESKYVRRSRTCQDKRADIWYPTSS